MGFLEGGGGCKVCVRTSTSIFGAFGASKLANLNIISDKAILFLGQNALVCGLIYKAQMQNNLTGVLTLTNCHVNVNGHAH